MTVGSPPSMTATTELVVPRSMPMIFPGMRSLSRKGLSLSANWLEQAPCLVPHAQNRLKTRRSPHDDSRRRDFSKSFDGILRRAAVDKAPRPWHGGCAAQSAEDLEVRAVAINERTPIMKRQSYAVGALLGLSLLMTSGLAIGQTQQAKNTVDEGR